MTDPLPARLPGRPGQTLELAYEALSPARQAALLPHLLGTTSSEYVSDWLRRAGRPVGATTIKRFRRTLAAGKAQA